jgi:hypothetical protein
MSLGREAPCGTVIPSSTESSLSIPLIQPSDRGRSRSTPRQSLPERPRAGVFALTHTGTDGTVVAHVAKVQPILGDLQFHRFPRYYPFGMPIYRHCEYQSLEYLPGKYSQVSSIRDGDGGDTHKCFQTRSMSDPVGPINIDPKPGGGACRTVKPDPPHWAYSAAHCGNSQVGRGHRMTLTHAGGWDARRRCRRGRRHSGRRGGRR